MWIFFFPLAQHDASTLCKLGIVVIVKLTTTLRCTIKVAWERMKGEALSYSLARVGLPLRCMLLVERKCRLGRSAGSGTCINHWFLVIKQMWAPVVARVWCFRKGGLVGVVDVLHGNNDAGRALWRRELKDTKYTKKDGELSHGVFGEKSKKVGSSKLLVQDGYEVKGYRFRNANRS